MLRLLEEVGEGAGIVAGLFEDATVQEGLAGRVEGAVQDGEELEGGRGQDVLVAACRLRGGPIKSVHALCFRGPFGASAGAR